MAKIAQEKSNGNEFQGGTETTATNNSIQVDADTAKRLGIKE